MEIYQQPAMRLCLHTHLFSVQPTVMFHVSMEIKEHINKDKLPLKMLC